MNHKSILLGTLAYTLVTFPLAVIWHVVLFEEKYHSFGYFEGEPNFVLGLLTIIIQGYVMSFLYPYVKFKGQGVIRGLKYSLLIGVFFWSSHVLAFVAKQVVDSSWSFVLMETFYLLIQFGIYGLLIGKIYAMAPENNASQKVQ
ncbi:hypothetical protein [Shewanella surugensis]|uniref:Uncharacterized protein n=1 Tax=Shewanella surugensis TaxID=212020 RepID=A0ABT0LJA2_9GAMM|nr:hypothetical protein [Shewanella surugensis]MCL1127792.1 hypothetical protein [Shewanella surugensis]